MASVLISTGSIVATPSGAMRIKKSDVETSRMVVQIYDIGNCLSTQ